MITGASGPGERIFSGLRSPYGQVEAMVKFELLVWEYCDSIHSEPMYSHHPCKYVFFQIISHIYELFRTHNSSQTTTLPECEYGDGQTPPEHRPAPSTALLSVPTSR